ncbi:MAG: Superfamily helicase [Myxococcaceae bacterium]|nr:Superfamily helicase [Myxococcaceae bacterium]
MESALTELSRQLLRSADHALLDLQLDDLCKRVSDESVRDVLAAVHETGEGDTLRALLQTDRLSSWAAETCTAREEEALTAQLRKWLGTGSAGGDDPARLTPIEPAPEPAEALLRWAERHGLTRTLMRPAHEVLPRVLGLGADLSLLDVCLGAHAGARGESMLRGQRAADEARAYLRGHAAELASLPVREALHRRSLPAGPLGVLARRLRAFVSGSELSELHRLRFVPARPVSLELEAGLARGALTLGDGLAPAQLTLLLSGYAQRALEGRCSACTEPRCLHLKALAARLLDACLLPDDRLQPLLQAFVSVPPWQRFMDALAPASESRRAPGTALSLSFSLRLDAERLAIAALQRRVLGDGKSTPGKLVSPHKLSRSAGQSDRDQAVLSAMAAQTRTLSPQYTPVDVLTLRALVEHPHVQLEGESAFVHVSEETLHVGLLEQPDGLLVEVTLAGKPVQSSARAREQHYVWHLDHAAQQLSFAVLTPPLSRLLSALSDFRGLLPPESYPQLAPWVASLRTVARVSSPKALDGMERPAPKRLLLRMTPLLDEGIDVSLTVRALPLAPLYAPGRGPELVHGLIDGAPCSVRRELLTERRLGAQVLEALALAEHLELGPFSYRIETTQGALELLSRAARLPEQLELEWAERARALRITSTVKHADLKVALFKRGDWCALSGGVQHGEHRIAIERLLEAARTGERFVVVEGESYVELEQTLFERLSQAQLVLPPISRDAAFPAAAVRSWFDSLGEQTEAGDEETASWLALARTEADSEASAPSPALAVELRDYQARGVAWLLSRSQWAPGVCLADEMGLGKTVQTLALLAARSDRGPALVVAPTSVVDNWISELRRFAPELKPLLYRGASRGLLLDQLAPGVVLVSSYDLILRDLSRFATLRFSTLVVDEAQVIKNARTLRARAVRSLAADFRVALSGTPVENRLGDLWSLFQLIVPSLLGSWSRFRARFAVPIERYENDERAAALRGLVSPFMLRRTKREVASELPERTEVVHLVELSRAEQDLYGAALAHARSAVGKRRRGDEGRAVQILAELTKLRQLACHPRLVLEDSRVTSSKLASLVQLLEDILPRGHRVLIFSQFVRHLALVEEALDALGASSLRLDGSTPAAARAALVQRFQGGEAQVFLISLKAGGTGLNLTAADYVVHMDPWWNPSVEDQASDRAHRIGQERPVTVVKLVSQGTIEERVLGLHDHKRRLSRAVLEDSSGQLEPGLELEALERLLRE